MPDSKLVQLADAIATLLNAQAFASYTAERSLAPHFTLQDLTTTPKFLVVPRNVSSNAETRGSSARTATLDIGIVTRSKTEAKSDEYIAVMEAVEEWLSGGSLRRFAAGTTTWSWTGNEMDLPYDPEGLSETSVFEAKVSATFRRLS